MLRGGQSRIFLQSERVGGMFGNVSVTKAMRFGAPGEAEKPRSRLPRWLGMRGCGEAGMRGCGAGWAVFPTASIARQRRCGPGTMLPQPASASCHFPGEVQNIFDHFSVHVLECQRYKLRGCSIVVPGGAGGSRGESSMPFNKYSLIFQEKLPNI